MRYEIPVIIFVIKNKIFVLIKNENNYNIIGFL